MTPAAAMWRAIGDINRVVTAVGWGMDLSLMADFRIASERARFGKLFVKRGLMSDVGGMCRLPEIVGPQKAAELLFTGELFDGQAAVDMGLAMKVVPHDNC